MNQSVTLSQFRTRLRSMGLLALCGFWFGTWGTCFPLKHPLSGQAAAAVGAWVKWKR